MRRCHLLSPPVLLSTNTLNWMITLQERWHIVCNADHHLASDQALNKGAATRAFLRPREDLRRISNFSNLWTHCRSLGRTRCSSPHTFPRGGDTHAEALIFGGRSRINNYLVLQPQSAIIQDALEACSKSSSFLVQLIHPGSTKFWSPSMWPGVRQSLGNNKLQKFISQE